MRMILNIRSLLTVAGLLGAAATMGCATAGESPGVEPGERVDVVATTMHVQDLARQVGGDRVRVTEILGPDDEPHAYEPVPSDADAVSEAAVVVANGANLDGWLDGLLEQADADAVRIEAVRGIELLPTEEKGFPGDPHVWHDPELAKRMVDNVAAGLGEADPPGRPYYRRNAERQKNRLDRMSAAIRAEFGSVAPQRRRLVTSHDAFGYFARAYDVEIVGSVLPAVTTDAEPSARQLRRLVEAIRRAGVRTIFTERAVEPRLERRVAAEAGARVSTSLYGDTLGPPGSGAETLVGAELANARAMRSAWRRP